MPVKDIAPRLPRLGEIRLGYKQGSQPRSSDTFIFTSGDEALLIKLAELYGGEVKPWSSKSGQFVLHSQAKELNVNIFMPQCSQWYENWGKHRDRDGIHLKVRCDGEMCKIPETGEEKPCLCAGQGERKCSLVVRVAVMLRDLDVMGSFVLKTSGFENAAEFLGVQSLVQNMRVVPCQIVMARRTRNVDGKQMSLPALSFRPDANAINQGTAPALVTHATAALPSHVTVEHDDDGSVDFSLSDLFEQKVEEFGFDEATMEEIFKSSKCKADQFEEWFIKASATCASLTEFLSYKG